MKPPQRGNAEAMSQGQHEQELARIIAEYHHRAATPAIAQRYRPEQANARLTNETIHRALRATLARRGLASLAGKRLLDVGCGNGGWLRSLVESYGAEPARCVGIDLLEDRIAAARAASPEMEWQVGSAHALPLPSASCDLILCFTVFSSILDDALCAALAEEMWRVLAPAGLILWYDAAYNNPQNRAVRGMPLARVRALFPEGAIVERQRILLAPPLARLIAPRAYWLARALERCKVLNTHLLVTLQKGR
jgi:SAM-dependent methyltransferase